LLAARALGPSGELVVTHPVSRRAPPAQNDGAHRDRGEAVLPVVGEPAVEGGAVGAGVRGAVPARGVAEPVLRVSAEHPGVAARPRDPTAGGLRPVLAAAERPVAEDDREAALFQVVRYPAHDLLADPRATGVAEREVAVGGDDVGRVADHEREALSLDRPEEVALPDLHVREAVHARSEP